MGRPKALLPYGESTFVRHIVSQLERSGIDPIIVVTGHDPGPIEAEVASTRAMCVHNAEYRAGMLSSVRCGLNHVPADAQRVLVALVDQPSITELLVRALFEAVTDTWSIAVPTYDGRRGHPLVFSVEHVPEVQTDFTDAGLRGLLRRHSNRVRELCWHDDSVLEDLNTPELYEQSNLKSRPN
jgi:molybdenum cofactor cytidylyltransferase